MAKDYIEERDGGYFVVGARVSLDSIIYAFLRGESPEGIADSFPALTLEQILGSLAFYLDHRSRIDQYLSEGKDAFESLRQEARRKNPSFYARLTDVRHKTSQPNV